MAIPTTEPVSVISGDTLTWQKSLPDYPANAGWTLKYRLLNATGKIDITAGASGADHLVSVSAATSAAWTAGTYDFAAWVENGSTRHTIGSGRMTVEPNPAALNTYDGRSVARKTVEALEAAMVAWAQGGQGHIAEYEIAGRRTKFRSAMEIESQLQFWRAELKSEERAARLAAGLKPRNKILVRFK